jgi:hypothetical protein
MSPALKVVIVLAALALVWTALAAVVYLGRLKVRAPVGGYITRNEHPQLFWFIVGIMALCSHGSVAVLAWILYAHVR